MPSPTRKILATLRAHLSLCICLALTLAVVLFIFGNSLQNGEQSGAASGWVSAILKAIFDPKDAIDPQTFEHFVRKLAHFTEFFWLGMAVCGVLRSLIDGKAPLLSRAPVGSGLFFLLLIAVCDEFIQSFTGRGPSVRDVMLDFCGAVCGLAITALLVYAVTRPKAAHRAKKNHGKQKT